MLSQQRYQLSVKILQRLIYIQSGHCDNSQLGCPYFRTGSHGPLIFLI